MRKIGFFLIFIGVFIFFAVLTTLVERSISMNLANRSYNIERRIEKKQQQIAKLEIVITDDLLTMSTYDSMSDYLEYYKLDIDSDIQIFIGSEDEYGI